MIGWLTSLFNRKHVRKEKVYLTDTQKVDVCKMRKEGHRVSSISKAFNISNSTVYSIIRSSK